ncbi:hypothetical protein NEDG_00683 [Nematocida displodere]|uniref:Uncharacterized protein n=1 Tax=Nematocida displodere TaxID=1805483 RepID=A0A177EDS6_9MICR|nr:hypothetical protein NEDG_00683 [Nematocida displodere]
MDTFYRGGIRRGGVVVMIASMIWAVLVVAVVGRTETGVFDDEVFLVSLGNSSERKPVERSMLLGFTIGPKYQRQRQGRYTIDHDPDLPRVHPEERKTFLTDSSFQKRIVSFFGTDSNYETLVRAWGSDKKTRETYPLPAQAVAHASLMFYMASVPGYIREYVKRTTLEDVAGVLWTFSLFDLDEFERAPGKYVSKGRGVVSKWHCFKENLKDLVFLHAEIAMEVTRVLRALDVQKNTMRSDMPAPLGIIAHDRIGWFFEMHPYQSIRWYLHTALCSYIEGMYIYTMYIDAPKRKNSVSIMFFKDKPKTGHSLSKMVRTQDTTAVREVSIAVDDGLGVDERVFNAVLDLFPNTEYINFTALGNRADLATNQSLIDLVLYRDEIRQYNGYPSSLSGLLVNYAFALSQSALAYLKNSALRKFGFLEYHPDPHLVKMLRRTDRDAVTPFLDTLIRGEMGFAAHINHLVAPDTFFFGDTSFYNALPNLEVIEVYLHTKEWKRLRVKRLSSFVHENLSIKRLVLVDTLPNQASHALTVLKYFSTLRQLASLNLTRTMLTVHHLAKALVSEPTTYTSSLSRLSFVYSSKDTPRKVATAPNETLSRLLSRYPKLKKLKIFLFGGSKSLSLHSLLTSLHLLLRTETAPIPKLASMFLIQRLDVQNLLSSSFFIVSPLRIHPSVVKPATKYLYDLRKATRHLSFEEFLLFIDHVSGSGSGSASASATASQH